MDDKLINVLLVEDNPGDTRLLQTMLRESGGFSELHVDRLSLAIDRLKDDRIDVVLLDLSLPDSQGAQTFLKIREAFPDVPLILLTGFNNIDLGLSAIREGVQDYLVKGQFDSGLLSRCIHYAMERKRSELLLRKTEKALNSSAKMAAIGQLTGGIAHDFNNMLTVILGRSEVLLNDPSLSVENRDHLQLIYDAGERAANLTRQLLTFSKKKPGKPVVTDLNTVILGLNKMLPKSIGEEISLHMELDDHTSKIKIDITQLEQVIMNLCINARDAMPNGGKLKIATKHADSDAILVIEDSGAGMSEAVKSHIFEPFFTTKEQGKGTGLGLTTVFGIVEQASGHIEVQSEVSKGTRFEIYFPITSEVLEPLQAQVSEKENFFGNEKILLVEDEDEVRSLLTAYLEEYGYQVTTANNGAEGRKHVLDGPEDGFDIIISDVRMPICSGRDMVESLREKLPRLKVIYMSGYAANIFGESEFQEDAITRFLAKPFSPKIMVSTVRKLLDQA